MKSLTSLTGGSPSVKCTGAEKSSHTHARTHATHAHTTPPGPRKKLFEHPHPLLSRGIRTLCAWAHIHPPRNPTSLRLFSVLFRSASPPSRRWSGLPCPSVSRMTDLNVCVHVRCGVCAETWAFPCLVSVLVKWEAKGIRS